MRCENCGLANLDHVTRCVKCGHELDSSNSPSNIENLQTYPPRANRLTKSFSNMFYSIRRKFARIPSESATEELDKPERPSLKEILMMLKPAFFGIIPGLGHWYAGRKILALIISVMYLLSLLLGVFFYGRFVSNLFFGSIISIHAVSIFDNLRFDREAGFRARFVLMFAIYAFVMMGYYYAYQGITSRIYGFWLTDNYAAPLVQSGDFILARVKPTYSCGEIVVFHRDRQSINGYGPRQQHAVIAGGQSFDRIIGCPGDKVSLKNRVIKLNGNLLPENMYPLNRNYVCPDMEVTLGENQYLIIPSTLRLRGDENIPVEILINYCKVNADHIDGYIYMIYAPLQRMKFLNQ